MAWVIIFPSAILSRYVAIDLPWAVKTYITNAVTSGKTNPDIRPVGILSYFSVNFIS
jgi:hypothetical protein